MKHYAGLDVSLEETSSCLVDETGSICRDMKASAIPGIWPACSRTRPGGRPSVAVAVQRIGRGWLDGGLHRDPPYRDVPQGPGEQHRNDRFS